MRDEQVKQNTTSKIVTITLRSATTGQFVTDAVAGDFSGAWAIAGGTTAALSFAVGVEGDAYSSGKICSRGDGTYDWHVPDSLLTALGQVVATINVTDAIDVRVEFQVVVVDREIASYGANTIAPDNAGITANGVAIGNVPSSGSGARVVTLTVSNDSLEVVEGVKVTIQTSAGVTIANRFDNTNSSGQVVFNLDDGDYKALVSEAAGYGTHTAEDFTVSSGSLTKSLTITATTSTPSGVGWLG